MEFKSVTIGSTLSLLVALVLPHAANATTAQKINQPSVTAAANGTQWLAVKRPERLKKMQIQPRPQAVLEIYNVAFDPKWDPLAVGLPIGTYVAFRNKGPALSTTSEFWIYLSRDGHVLEKKRVLLTRGLRGGRAASTKFQITLPDKPGRYCWEVSVRQTDDGRMKLGGPKTLCAPY